MPANDYFHGIQVIEETVQAVALSSSTCVAIVGVAPKGTAHQPRLITTSKEATDTFGNAQPGTSIPQALATLFRYGVGRVAVINVYDGVARTAVAEADYTFTSNLLTLPHQYVSTVVVKNQGGTTTYVLNTDYTVNTDTGTIARVTTGTIAAGATVKVSYQRQNYTSVTATNIVGGVNGITGAREGIEALLDCYTKLGVRPKIFITPGFSSVLSVGNKLATIADKLRAVYILDSPAAITPAEAINGRTGQGAAAHFQTNDERAILTYPAFLKVGTENEYFSTNLAGVIARLDSQLGQWRSPSNQELTGITGFETAIYTSYTDPDSDSNSLNAQGIVTYRVDPGSPPKTSGNNNAAFPSLSSAINLINVVRARDMVSDELEKQSLPYLDAPLNKATIDAITEMGLSILNSQPSGSLLSGASMQYLPTQSDLPARKLMFGLSFMPSVPIELISYRSKLDVSLLVNLRVG